MKINVDFRLLDVSLELHALEDHYELIEKQISHLSHSEKVSLGEYLKKENLTPEGPEWDLAIQECDHKVEFLLPRFFWGPFIVSLYAVIETSVIEIARLIQQSQKQGIAINDLRGDFLERAKKYYKNVIKFELCSDTTIWQRIKILAEVRHVIAHANGRLDMLNENTRKRIEALEKQNLGISRKIYENDDTGAPAYDPAILLKIILYAYSRGITSSRKIAQCCEENIIFMALSADTRPHFITIADFISTLDKEIIRLFLEVLMICEEMGLIGKEMFAVDGCKLPSNASKEGSGTKEELWHKKDKMEQAIKQILTRHRETDAKEKDKGIIEQEEKYIKTIKNEPPIVSIGG